MKTSAEGIALIASFEGLGLEAYQDGAGIWTIGYGHTRGVTPGDSCTEDQAKAWLAEDLTQAEGCVSAAVQVTVSQNQFDALVSFTFNLGCGAFEGSTLLRELNGGSYILASNQFPRWSKVAGVESAGLLRRRVAEQDLFARHGVEAV